MEEISLEELKEFFKNNEATLPQTINLGAGVTITHVSKHIQSSLMIIEAQGNNPSYRCFKDDLIKLKNLLSSKENEA